MLMQNYLNQGPIDLLIRTFKDSLMTKIKVGKLMRNGRYKINIIYFLRFPTVKTS